MEVMGGCASFPILAQLCVTMFERLHKTYLGGLRLSNFGCQTFILTFYFPIQLNMIKNPTRNQSLLIHVWRDFARNKTLDPSLEVDTTYPSPQQCMLDMERRGDGKEGGREDGLPLG